MTSWLIDKSALVRLAASPDAADWASRIERGPVRIATVTRLEVGRAVEVLATSPGRQSSDLTPDDRGRC